jgi:hypothetical protein
MKYVLLSLFVLLNVSCSSANTSNDEDTSLNASKELRVDEAKSDNLIEAIDIAIKNNDYRLLVTSGRSMSIPGVKASHYKAMIELCGKKYTSEAGDVLTSEEQRQERKKLVTYMRQYNEQMLVMCQENSMK